MGIQIRFHYRALLYANEKEITRAPGNDIVEPT